MGQFFEFLEPCPSRKELFLLCYLELGEREFNLALGRELPVEPFSVYPGFHFPHEHRLVVQEVEDFAVPSVFTDYALNEHS